MALAAGWEPTADTARQVLEHARDVLPVYARVRRVEFAELPKTISGKIRRVELRELEERAAASGTPAVGEWREDQFPGAARHARRRGARRELTRRQPGATDHRTGGPGRARTAPPVRW